MGRAVPERLGPVVDDLIDRILVSEEVLFGIDFDGTLAPLVAHPDQAAADPRAISALERIAGAPGVEVAIVSGRGWADLHTRTGDVAGVSLVGGHGTETGPGGESDDLTRVEERLTSAVESLPGAWIEHKNHSLGLHYRAVDSGDLRQVLDDLREWVTGQSNLHLLESKRILEIGARPLSKAAAMADLKESFGSDIMVYIGDDTTDESVFEAMTMDDIGIKVGGGDTAARSRLDGPDDVTRFLEALADRVGERSGR